MSRRMTGRRKIDIMKIEEKKNLQATFSRRRAGVFKKANELSVLCGAEMAIIVFSPGQKAYTFGHPNVHTVTDSFLTRNPPAKSQFVQYAEDLRKANVQELSMQLFKVQRELEAERQREKEITEMMMTKQTRQWWEKPVDELNMSQLQELKTYLAGLEQILSANLGN